MKPLISLVATSLTLLLAGPADAQTGDPDGVIIKRGAAEITHAELDARLAQIPEGDRKPFLANANRLEELLGQLLIREQLAIDARAAGFDQRATTEAAMKLAAENALAQAWLNEYVENAPPADYEALAREQYQARQDEFVTPPTVDVTHILIGTSERSDEEALELAEKLLAEIEADPTRFDALVLEYSDDPAAAGNRGRYVGVREGQMVPAFEQAAFGAESVGDIVGPVKTQYGYHLIRLDGREASRPLTYAEVEPQLLRAVRRQHQDRVRSEYLSSVGKAPVELREGAVEEVLLRYFSVDELRAMGIMDPDSAASAGDADETSQ